MVFSSQRKGYLKINKYEAYKAPFADQQKGIKKMVTGTSRSCP